MKKIFLGICILILVNSFVFAGTQIIKDGGAITKYVISIELTPAQYKAIAYDVYSVEDWIRNAAFNKARQVTDKIILKVTDKNPKKISIAEKETIVNNAEIKSAKERQIESEENFK